MIIITGILFLVFFKSSTGHIAVFLRVKYYGWLEPLRSKLIITQKKKINKWHGCTFSSVCNSNSSLLLQMYPKSSTEKMESSNSWCPLSWRFRNTSYLNGNCLSEGKKCIDFLTEDRNTLISSDYTEPHNGVRMLRPTIHTEFKHCKSSSNKSLNKQKR